MCEYRELNNCKITNSVCPWVYYCDKINAWKELSKAPKVCSVTHKAKVPDGEYKVEFERKGYLYVEIEGSIVKIKNPYNHIPLSVKAYKAKDNTWKIKK